MRIGAGQSGFAHAHQHRGVASRDMDIGGHRAQALATDHAKLSGRQAAPQVAVLGWVGQIAESFDVDRTDREGRPDTSFDLQASGYGNAQDNSESKGSGDDDDNGQTHCSSRRSSSRFQIARVFSGSETADVVALF